METIFLSQNTMLITLSGSDTEKYGCSNADDVIASIREILHDACGGFDYLYNGESLTAELFMSPGGGCEIFITKTGVNDMLYDCENTTKNEKGSCRYYYKFEDTEALLAFCRETTSSTESTASEIYYDAVSDVFYAATDTESFQAHEFGAESCTELDGYYISEHFEKLSESTARSLAALAL